MLANTIKLNIDTASQLSDQEKAHIGIELLRKLNIMLGEAQLGSLDGLHGTFTFTEKES